jgi:hypothetical protein
MVTLNACTFDSTFSLWLLTIWGCNQNISEAELFLFFLLAIKSVYSFFLVNPCDQIQKLVVFMNLACNLSYSLVNNTWIALCRPLLFFALSRSWIHLLMNCLPFSCYIRVQHLVYCLYPISWILFCFCCSHLTGLRKLSSRSLNKRHESPATRGCNFWWMDFFRDDIWVKRTWMTQQII